MCRNHRFISLAEKKISRGDPQRKGRLGALIAKGSTVISAAENHSKPRRPFSQKRVPAPLLS